MDGYSELINNPQMLPPPDGSFIDREELIQYVGEFGISQGYVVTIKHSKKDRDVILGCDRGGVQRNRTKSKDEASTERVRKRKRSGSRLTNCPFELVGKNEDGLWLLTTRNGSHNHEALTDITQHPSARRFTEKEVLLIKEMTEAGSKPNEILKKLRQNNPELLSTRKHIYNLKAKLRQGKLAVRRFKTLGFAEGTSNSSTPTESSWRRRYPSRVPNLIGGKFVDSQSSTTIDVRNPATQQVVAQVPLTTIGEFKAAICAAKRAFSSWRCTPLTTRQRIMFKLQELIRRDIDKISHNITTEQGKTLKDSHSEVLRGLEVVEHAFGMGTLQMGEFASNQSNGTDSYSIREPLGICAGICPFNFPAMVPLWMFPIAVICGNTFILKPSEIAPGACMMLAELAMEAGLPDGVLNIVHGTDAIITAICDDDDIKAVSFVGSDPVVSYIHARASASGKRVQSSIGAKNHAIIMPDATTSATLDALIGTGFGAAGQRCTTLSTVVFVGGSKSWEDKLVERAMALKVNAGTEPDSELGPVISKQAKQKICRLIQMSVDSGARLVLDGRQIVVPKYELGNFIGPTILCDVTDSMECYKEEIIGPVLLCMQANSLDEAINIVNRNKHKNGVSIFTSSGVAARKFQTAIEAGQVGINVAVPAPLPLYSFTGSRAFFSGDLNLYGKAGLHFYTQIKTVTQLWKDYQNNEVALPESSLNDCSSSDGGGSLGLQSGEDLQSRDGLSPSLPLGDFDSHNGVTLALPLQGFQSSNGGEPLVFQEKDFLGSDGGSPTMPVADETPWTQDA